MRCYYSLFKLLLLTVLLNTLCLPDSSQAQITQKDTDKRGIYDKAFELWENEKYGAAQQQFDHYLATGESKLLKARALFYKARCAMELYQKETEYLFKQYIKRYPELGNTNLAYFNLGKYHFRRKNLEESRAYFRKLNQSELASATQNELHFMMGYALYKDKKYQEAKTHLSAIMNKPNAYYASGNYYYGYIAYLEKKYDTAVKRFMNIEGDDKFGKVVPVYITQFHLLSGRYDSTISYGRQKLNDKKVGKKAEIRSYMGEAAFHRQEFDSVIKYMEPLRSSGFELSREQKYKLGYSYLQSGENKKALNLLKKLDIKKDTLGQNMAYHLGDLYIAEGDKEQARNSFNFAAGLDFNEKIKEKSAFRYAKLSFDLGYQKTAIRELKAFIDQYSESKLKDEAQTLLGNILLNTKNYRQALSLIEDVRDPNDQMLEAYQKLAYQRGIELYQDNNYREAREIFIKALERPRNEKFKALSYFWLAESYYHLQSYEKASREFKNFLYQEIAKKTPYYRIAYYNLGYSYFMMKDYGNALKPFNQYLNLDRTNPNSQRYTDVVLRLADCHFALKNKQQANEYYTKVIENNKKEVPYALYQKGMLLGLQGKEDQKIKTLKKLSQNYGQSQYVDDALFEIGMVYLNRKENQLAYNQFRYLSQEYPNSSYYRLTFVKMAMARYNQGKNDEAIDVFQQVIRKYPYSREAKRSIAQLKNIYIEMGQADSLFAFLKTVENADLSASFKDSASYSSAFSYIKKNDCEGAIPAFKQYLEKFQEGHLMINAHYYLAECSYKQGFTEQALVHYKKVMDKGANQFIEPSLQSLSEIYYERGDCENALEYYHQLREVATKSYNRLKSYIGLTRCNFKVGNYNSTIKNAEKILKLSAASAEQKTEARYYIAQSRYKLDQ